MKKAIILILILFLFFSTQAFGKILYKGIPHLDSLIYYYNLGVKEISKNRKYDNYGFNNAYFQHSLYSVGWRPQYQWCAFTQSSMIEKNKDLIESPTIKTGVATKFIISNSISAKKVIQGLVTIYPGTFAVWRHGTTWKGHIAQTLDTCKSAKAKTIEGNYSNKIAIVNRTISPRDYFRIIYFTKVKYKTIQKLDSIDFKDFETIHNWINPIMLEFKATLDTNIMFYYYKLY